jgi:hypothetical protein
MHYVNDEDPMVLARTHTRALPQDVVKFSVDRARPCANRRPTTGRPDDCRPSSGAMDRFLREKLAKVRVADDDAARGIELHAFVSAIVGPDAQGRARRGATTWDNAKTRYDKVVEKPHPWPETHRGRVGGVENVVVFKHGDMRTVIRCAIPKLKLQASLRELAPHLRAFLQRNNFPTTDFDDFQAEVEAELKDVQVAFGTQSPIRVTRLPDITPDLVAAMDDLLFAIGIPDPKNDWAKWLGQAILALIPHVGSHWRSTGNAEKNAENPETFSDSGASSSHGPTAASSAGEPILTTTAFQGSRNQVRVINYAMFRLVLKVYMDRGKLGKEHVSSALRLYEKFRVGDLRIIDDVLENAIAAPQEARAFVLGDAEVERQASMDAPQPLEPSVISSLGSRKRRLSKLCTSLRPNKAARATSSVADDLAIVAVVQQVKAELALRDKRYEEAPRNAHARRHESVGHALCE